IRRSVQALAELRCETRKMAFCSGGVVNPGIVMEHPAMRAAVEVLMHRLDARLHQGFDEKSGLLRRITGVLVGCPDIEAGADAIQMKMRARGIIGGQIATVE